MEKVLLFAIMQAEGPLRALFSQSLIHKLFPFSTAKPPLPTTPSNPLRLDRERDFGVT